MSSTANRLLLSIFAVAMLQSGGIGQVNGEKRPGIVECASRSIDFPAPGTLSSDGTKIYLATLSGNVLALDPASLTIEWRAELGGDFVSSIVANGTNIFTVNEPASPGNNTERPISTIRAIRKETGVVDWSTSLPFAGPVNLVRWNGVVFAASGGGIVAVIDEKTGTILRQISVGEPLSAASASPANGIIVATKEKWLRLLTAFSDEASGFLSTDFVQTAMLIKRDRGLIVGDERGNVLQYDENKTDPAWRFRAGGQISGLFEVEDGVLITSYDNFVYLVSDYNGDVIWKRRLNGRLNGVGLTLNGYFVVAEPAESSVVVLDLKSGKIVDTAIVGDASGFGRGMAAAGIDRFAVSSGKAVKLFGVGGCGPK